MRLLHTIRLSLLLLATISLIGCTTQTIRQSSGFLSGYEQFRPGPEGGVDRIWTDQAIRDRATLNRKLSAYDSIIIEPIWVIPGNQENRYGIEPGELHRLSQQLRDELIHALQPGYRVVSQPGPNTLRLRLALTGLESPNAVLAATSTLLPIGIGISAISKLATGEHTNVGSASIEAAVEDSQTGRTLFAAIDRRAGEKDLANISDPQHAAKLAFRWWASRLAETLQAGRSVK